MESIKETKNPRHSTNFIRILKTDNELIREAFLNLLKHTTSDQREELFEDAYQLTGLNDERPYDSDKLISKIIKVAIIYEYLTSNTLQGEPVTKEAKFIIRQILDNRPLLIKREKPTGASKRTGKPYTGPIFDDMN